MYPPNPVPIIEAPVSGARVHGESSRHNWEHCAAAPGCMLIEVWAS